MSYKIYHFSDESGETEFVVISDRDALEIRSEFCTDAVTLDGSLEIEGDAVFMPCDRKLSK